jgi:hypothetical protein
LATCAEPRSADCTRRLNQFSITLPKKPCAIRKSTTVGKSERQAKASTRRVRKRAPSMRLRRSKMSFTRLRATRKMSSTSRIRLRLMSRKKTMLLDCGGLSRKSGNRVW